MLGPHAHKSCKITMHPSVIVADFSRIIIISATRISNFSPDDGGGCRQPLLVKRLIDRALHRCYFSGSALSSLFNLSRVGTLGSLFLWTLASHPDQRNHGPCPIPSPAAIPNEAYEVVELAGACRKPCDPIGWYLCLCNGIPVRFAADRDSLERYASDPEYRASLIRRKAWEKNAGN
jgi:hypothetical protein